MLTDLDSVIFTIKCGEAPTDKFAGVADESESIWLLNLDSPKFVYYMSSNNRVFRENLGSGFIMELNENNGRYKIDGSWITTTKLMSFKGEQYGV